MSLTTDLELIYEDEYLLVICKPSGLVVNNSDTAPEETLQNYLIKKLNLTADDSEFYLRSGILHRLDKDTSGVLVVAKTLEAFNEIKLQFQARKVKKEYDAVVLDKIVDPLIEIDAPLKRNPQIRTRIAIHKDGRPSLTKLELKKVFTKENIDMSYIKVFPLTGRTHQIRVHLSAINHPVIGDRIYMTKKQLADTYHIFGRLMLHAGLLSFYHPYLKKEVKFIAPIPKEFKEFYSK